MQNIELFDAFIILLHQEKNRCIAAHRWAAATAFRRQLDWWNDHAIDSADETIQIAYDQLRHIINASIDTLMSPSVDIDYQVALYPEDAAETNVEQPEAYRLENGFTQLAHNQMLHESGNNIFDWDLIRGNNGK